MKTLNTRPLALALILILASYPVFATCAGGGGGGGGGMSSGGSSGGMSPPVYHVPWKIRKQDELANNGLVLYWFPASKEELQKSSLRESRVLSLYASQCISMELADGNTPGALKLLGESKV